MADLQRSLPDGVEIVATYDRSTLIDAAVENLWKKLAEEFIVVAIVCALFLVPYPVILGHRTESACRYS
ncbi:efflux RND transporter permease subunit [Vibrio sinaloensis]|nr:efflux RND transporter permease subunit [Vibrio sinaloensis]